MLGVKTEVNIFSCEHTIISHGLGWKSNCFLDNIAPTKRTEQARVFSLYADIILAKVGKFFTHNGAEMWQAACSPYSWKFASLENPNGNPSGKLFNY